MIITALLYRVYLKVFWEKIRRDFPTTEQGRVFTSVSCILAKAVFETGKTIDNYHTVIQGVSKPTDALISKFILVRNSTTCFGQFLCPSSGLIHCTFGTGTCYTGLTTGSVQNQDGTISSILILHATCRQTFITCASAECTVDNS